MSFDLRPHTLDPMSQQCEPSPKEAAQDQEIVELTGP